MNNLSKGLIYEGGCHSLLEFILSVPGFTHLQLTDGLSDWLNDNLCYPVISSSTFLHSDVAQLLWSGTVFV